MRLSYTCALLYLLQIHLLFQGIVTRRVPQWFFKIVTFKLKYLDTYLERLENTITLQIKMTDFSRSPQIIRNHKGESYCLDIS